MGKYGFVGLNAAATNDVSMAAYCAGRAAAIAGSVITANPHTTDSPNWVAWRSGWVSFVSTGTVVEWDCCTQATKFTNPTLVVSRVGSDTTDATYDATTAVGGLPNLIDWGDGDQTERAPGSSVVARHTYRASGTYVIKCYYLGKVRDSDTITVDIT